MASNHTADWLRRNRAALIVLLAALVIFLAVRAIVAPEKAAPNTAGDYVEYDNGKVLQILSDSTERDETSDGAFRGEQMMLVQVTTGQYKGETLQVYNYVGPLYGAPLKAGDRCTLTVSTYANGDVNATVYEYNRAAPLVIVAALFLIVTVLVGGRTGAKSLVGLIFTVLCVFFLLFPALMKGAPTLLSTFLLCVYVAAVSFVILGGVQKKTVCALLGTVAGMALALVFALLAQRLLRINGLRGADVEPLLQLRQTGTPIRLRGLLAAGVILSALGAVMDVAMSLSSALSEVHAADPALGEALAPYIVSNTVVISDNGIEFQLGEAESHEVVTETKENALAIGSFPRIRDAGFPDEVYLGVIANSPRTEEALRYLRYLAEAAG